MIVAIINEEQKRDLLIAKRRLRTYHGEERKREREAKEKERRE